ncbi:MAG: glycosyltransferase family 2 protein [Bacteroidetes bacterium]|nr:glycosyltransferase family 2 protein [Bacteroidota bacterium]
MPEKPVADISIVTPNYNNGRFLAEFIESIVNSTCLPRELILVDDGSTDESVAVLEKFASLAYLKIIRFAEHRGITDALNAGLEAATGRYIMRADPDDTLFHERIERQYHYMEAHPETGIAGCQVQYFHFKTGRNLNVSNFPAGHADIVKAYRYGVNGIQHPAAIIRRAIIQGYRYEKVFPGEDYTFFSGLARDGFKFANLSEPLYRMRIHPASSTSTITFQGIENIFGIRDRIWGTRTPKIRIVLYFYYIYFYRKYQLSTNRVTRYCFLALAGICFPVRIIKRFIHT